jgi:hypothetical protein
MLFKQKNKWDFGSANLSQQKHGKGNSDLQNKGQSKDNEPRDNQSESQAKKGNGKMKKYTRKWC